MLLTLGCGRSVGLGVRDLQMHTVQHLPLLHGSWSLEAQDEKKMLWARRGAKNLESKQFPNFALSKSALS